MKYNAILVDDDDSTINHTITVFKRMPELTLVSSYREVKSAMGQSSVFDPNLFLIDIDVAENRSMLPAFADIFPNAVVLGIMSKWDADKAFESINNGAIGCVLKPFSAEDLIDAIKIFSRGVRNTRPRSCSFFSAKGRSGKTTLIANIALSIVQQTGDMVAIIDADLQFSDMAIFFDVEPITTIVEATRDIKFLSPIRLNPYFLPVSENIQLLCGPRRLEYSELVDVESLMAVVRMAQTLFHYVLIDLPSGLSPFATNMCEVADTVFICGMLNTNFEVKHIKRTLPLFELWEQYGKKINIVFSRADDRQKLEIERQLGHKVAAVLPNEFLMVSAANSGNIKNVMNQKNLLAAKINEIAGKIINDAY
ncbi:MAG: AAA family ATPase [Selenomonadaceae bacterium]|nr:AAA family ATPase [Selenomonadaceae bacterium]